MLSVDEVVGHRDPTVGVVPWWWGSLVGRVGWCGNGVVEVEGWYNFERQGERSSPCARRKGVVECKKSASKLKL